MPIEFVFTLILRIEQGCENLPRKGNEKKYCFENCAQSEDKEGRRKKEIKKES